VASTEEQAESAVDAHAAIGANVPGDAGSASTATMGCPAGSTLRQAMPRCLHEDHNLTIPSTLTADRPGGDVVSLGGLREDRVPCLSVVVCTPSDAPTLFFSDSPESPARDGVLYAARLTAGRHRLYVYHANSGAETRKFPLVALNDGDQPATMTIVRRGIAAPSTAYVAVGRKVLADWRTDRAATTVIVPPGLRVLVDRELDELHAAKNELVHAMYDVVVSAPLKISTVSVLASADAVQKTASLPLLPRDPNHQRGTFRDAEQIFAIAERPPAGLGRFPVGAEPLEGVDETTGERQRLVGQYGVLYRLELGLPAGTTAFLSPRGGAWAGIAHGASSVLLPAATEAVASQTEAIAIGSETSLEGLELMTGGSTNLPVDALFVVP
jgi:hypothetical protein